MSFLKELQQKDPQRYQELEAKAVHYGYIRPEQTLAEADNAWLQAWAKAELLGTRPYGLARTTIMAAAGRPASAEDKERESVASAIAEYANNKRLGMQTGGTVNRGLTREQQQAADGIAAYANRWRQR